MTEDDLRVPVPGILRKTLLLTLGLALASVAIGHWSWARGVALGGLASAVNFFLMAWLLPRSLGGGSRRRAEGWSLLSLGLRFAIMGLALGIALYHPRYLAPGACAAGLFTVQLTLLFDRLVLARWTGGAAGSR